MPKEKKYIVFQKETIPLKTYIEIFKLLTPLHIHNTCTNASKFEIWKAFLPNPISELIHRDHCRKNLFPSILIVNVMKLFSTQRANLVLYVGL